MDAPRLAIFVDDGDGGVGIGLAIADASIVEMENGELVAGCKFSVGQALRLWQELETCIAQISQ